MTTLSVENLALTGNLGQEFDLDVVAKTVPNIDYTSQFNAVTYRHDNGSMNLFRTGKCVVTGMADPSDALQVVESFIDHLDIPLEPPSLQVRNMVCSGDFDTSLDLATVVVALGFEHAEYEPEQFPGCVYHPPNRDVTVLLFSSGRCVVTGGCSFEKSQQAYDEASSLLSSFDIL